MKFNIPHDAAIYIERLNFLHNQSLFTIAYILKHKELQNCLSQYEQDYINNYCELQIANQLLIFSLVGKMINNYKIDLNNDILEVYDEI